MWLVAQDGIHPPMFWNGQDAPRLSDLAKNEMPVGSVMAFIHGRFVVASADGRNSIYVGDIAYGETLTKPDDILNFTEQTYWAEGGSFNTPANFGDIIGMYPMPFLDTGTGQNELVVGCQFGFTSLDLSTPRQQWIDNQVQRVSLIGDGLASSHGFAGLNGDMFFRSQSGINSYRNARVEYSQRWNQTPVSREVNYWLKPDRSAYLEFVPMVSFKNMILCGCSPFVSRPNNAEFGMHRYCRGMVVFDADAMSTAGRDGAPVWHGMWSGIRPWAFAQGFLNGGNHCYAFSYDRDGRNRLYEITLTDGDDLFGSQKRKIQSSFTSAMLGSVETVTNFFQPKILNGGTLELSEIKGQISFTVEYKPDGTPCWVYVDSGEPGCDCPTRKTCAEDPTRPLTAAPQWARKNLQQISDKVCTPGSVQPANVFHHCQSRISGIGSFRIDRFNFRFQLRTDAQIAQCMGQNCAPIDCCPNVDDYAYHIAPAGVNDEVPELPPGPGVKPFVSTRISRLCCSAAPSVCVTAFGQGESFVSQQDADLKAQAAANKNAQESLVCPDQSTAILADFYIDGGDEDLSAYFVAGVADGFTNQPWRLYDVITESYIASGHIDENGTMITDSTFAEYTHGSFDPNTNIYTDNDSGWTRIQLQIGTNVFGNYSWPTVGAYGS